MKDAITVGLGALYGRPFVFAVATAMLLGIGYCPTDVDQLKAQDASTVFAALQTIGAQQLIGVRTERRVSVRVPL